MAERGNRLYRFLDRYIGIPFTIPAAIFRRLDRRRKQDNNVFKIAVICLGAIGDLLLLSGLLNGIKKLYPKSETTLFTSMDNRSAAQLLENTDHIYSFPVSAFIKTIRFMRQNRFDLLIDSTQWARVGAVISAFSGAGYTIGFATKGEARGLAYDETVHHSDLRHEWENFASLLQTDITALKPSLKIQAETEKLIRLLPKEEFIVLHRSASGRYKTEKEWEDEKWGAIAAYITQRGLSVIFSGSADDRGGAESLIQKYLPKNSNVINLAGVLSLEELAALVRKSKAVISVNTGIMHLAALYGAFTIGLHGPSSPTRWGPAGGNTVSLVPEGVTEFPPMKGEKIKDTRSFARNIKTEDVIKSLERII
jgi:ADP-heptose:LPS heptosyltransferase